MLFWWNYETGLGLYAFLVWGWHAGHVYHWKRISRPSPDCRSVPAFLFAIFLLRVIHSPAGHFRRERTSGGDTLRIPSPSASKCLHPQSLSGTGNTNALRLNVYFPCPLLCMEALTRTRFGINRVSVIDGRRCGSVRLSNEHK